MNRLDVAELACINGWKFHNYYKENHMVSYVKYTDKKVIPSRIDVSFSQLNKQIATVLTTINHPVIGRSQLIRKNIGFKLLSKIFKNPRIHTTKCRAFRTKNIRKAV